MKFLALGEAGSCSRPTGPKSAHQGGTDSLCRVYTKHNLSCVTLATSLKLHRISRFAESTSIREYSQVSSETKKMNFRQILFALLY